MPPIVAQYPLANYSSLELALSAIGTDAVFACTASTATQLLSKYVPIWSYEFDDPDAPQIILPPVSYSYGAYHGSELQYVFDVREPIPGDLNAAQQRLSDAMILHWSNFVRFGNPNTLQTSGWPRYQPPQTDRVSFSLRRCHRPILKRRSGRITNARFGLHFFKAEVAEPAPNIPGY